MYILGEGEGEGPCGGESRRENKIYIYIQFIVSMM
jgi:hypothetical protein